MSFHARFDRAVARLATPLGKLYPDGFGRELDARVAQLKDFSIGDEPAFVRWSPTRRVLGVPVRRGQFNSPAAHYLPSESRVGVVEHWDAGANAPLCLVLAATAEEGFARRGPLARYLVAQGLSVLLLENPFYGARRPHGQRGPMLRTVADQFAMNTATVEEACALLRTFHASGLEVGVTGYSQGGVMAAFAAALSDYALSVVPRGAARASGPIFTGGALSDTIRWDVLGREAGSEAAAGARFDEALSWVRLDRHAPPRDASRAILVAGEDDGYIPAAEAEALHRHWPGSELRWTRGGHLTGLVLHHDVHRRAILDAFARRRAAR